MIWLCSEVMGLRIIEKRESVIARNVPSVIARNEVTKQSHELALNNGIASLRSQ